jgi:hypothetical protein
LQPQKHDTPDKSVKEIRIHPTYHIIYDTPLENEEEKSTAGNLPIDTG